MLQYLNRYSIAVLKGLSKFELRRVGGVVNATPFERMGTPTREEVGWVDVYETVGDPMMQASLTRGAILWLIVNWLSKIKVFVRFAAPREIL